MRLNRYLAAAGLGSRRGCEDLVRTGQVTINGQLSTDLATQVEPGDAVKVSGRLIHQQPLQYVLLNKPRGYVCSADDELERLTIFDLLPEKWPRLHHVGRLDKESEGLILLTNDGELSLHLTHPRFKMEKEYEVTLDRNFDFEQAAVLRKGIYIDSAHQQSQIAHRAEARDETPDPADVLQHRLGGRAPGAYPHRADRGQGIAREPMAIPFQSRVGGLALPTEIG